MSVSSITRRAVRYWRRNRHYWSLGKLANAALARAAWRLRLTYTPAMPMVAKIEATNICNGTCRLCPVGRKEPLGRPPGMMDWDTYRRLIDQVSRWAHTVDLTNWGESLLHPRILDMVSYAHHAGLYTYLSTNLHTVRDRHVDGLMTRGLDELTLSLHGLSRQTYAAYQPGFDFDEACAVIDRLVEARRRAGRAERLKITLNFVVTAINEHEAPRLAEFARRRGVEGALSEASLNLRFLVSQDMVRRDPAHARRIIAEQADRWLPKDRRHVRPLYHAARQEPATLYGGRKRAACDWPWTTLVVNWDGSVSACCGSFEPSDDVGRYQGQPLRLLWNSPAMRACRASFRRAGAAKAHMPVLCGRCPGVLL